MDGAKPAPEKAKIEKKIVREIEINSAVEEVWRALTDPDELAKWFPLEARVTPASGEAKRMGESICPGAGLRGGSADRGAGAGAASRLAKGGRAGGLAD